MQLDLFSSLKLQLESLKSKSTALGPIFDFLLKITYFKQECSIYGIDVLSFYIPLIEPYILRSGMQIIDITQEYIVVEGAIRGQKSNGYAGNLYRQGVMIDPSMEIVKKESEREIFISEDGDAKLLKVIRNAQSETVEKAVSKLNKFQKERIITNRENQKIIYAEKEKQVLKQKIQVFQFFRSLGSFDITQIACFSKSVILPKGTITHKLGSQVQNLCFLIKGQIKLDNSAFDEQCYIEPGQMLLKKYMIHRRQNNTNNIISFLEPGEWIGLEQNLNGKKFMSSGEVVSHDAEVLYVPLKIFRKKINQKTYYAQIMKIKESINNKMNLLNKALIMKKQKTLQTQQQKQKIEAIQQIKKRTNLKSINNKLKQGNQSEIKNKSSEKNAKIKHSQFSYKKQCKMPESMIHKIKMHKEKQQLQPITQRFNFFPQLYEKAMVPKQVRDQLKLYDSILMKRKNTEAKPYKFIKSQKIYERIIFDTLSPKKQNPEQFSNRSLTKMDSRRSIINNKNYSLDIANKKKSNQTIHLSSINHSREHYNESIFNNFKASKVSHQSRKQFQNMMKTLQIL